MGTKSAASSTASKPDAQEGTECRINQRGEFGASSAGSHLADIGVHDRQIRANADASDEARDIKIGDVITQCAIQRANGCDRQSQHHGIAPPKAIGYRSQAQGTEDIAHQIEQRRYANASRGDLRRTPGHNLDTRLNEGDVDVEDIVEREQEAHAKHEEKCRMKCPNSNSVLAGNHHTRAYICRCCSGCNKV